MPIPSSPHPPLWGGSHSHANLSISHTTGGFAVPLGPPTEGDDPDSATLEMLQGSNPRRIQDHSTSMFHTHISPSFAATSSFGPHSYVDDSGPQSSTIDPRRSIPLSENSSSEANPWSALSATGVPEGSSRPATGPRTDRNTFLSPRKSIDRRSRSFKDSGLGTEEPSQYDTQSQLSQPPAEMNSQIPSYYPVPLPSQREPEEVTYTDDEDYQDPAQLEVAPETPTPTRKGTRQSTKIKEELKCEHCGKSVKTPSDMKKHTAGHQLPFLCTYPQCPRGSKGFATINDLNRHRKSVHNALTPGSRSFKCFAHGCSKSEKIWPRLDNFKQHLKRLHPNDNLEELLRRSDDWYDQEHPEDPAQSHAVRNELRSQERNVAEENKRKRARTQHPNDGPDKRSRPNTMAVPSAPSSQAMSYSLSASAQPRSRGTGRSPATSAQNHPQHRSTPLRRHGANRAAPSSASALTQSMSRPRSSSVQQVPNHINSQNAPQNALITPDLDPQLLQWPQGEQPEIPQVPQRGFSIIEQNFFQPPQFMLDPVQPTRNPPRTIAHPGDLAELQDPQINFAWWTDQFPQPHAECVLPERDLLAEIGAGNDTILDTSPLDHMLTTPTIRVSDHEVDSRVTPDSDLRHKLRALLDDYDANENGIGQPTIAEEHQQLRKKLFELLGSDSTRATGSETSLYQSSSGESRYPAKDTKCPICDKVKKLPSDLKKHLKRHSRPYGCVLDDCFKRFGSKNDWKRHEGTHRTQAQCFRCDGRHSCPDTGVPCKKVFYNDKDEYCQHLLKCGVPLSNVNDVAERRLIQNNNQKGFWCGFCDDIKKHDSEGLEALNERLNHIDQHFHKDGCKNDDWIELGAEGKKKSEVQKLQNETKMQQDVEKRPDAAMHQDEHHESQDSTNSMTSSFSTSGSSASSVSSPPPPTLQSQKPNYFGGDVHKESQQTTQHMSQGLQRQLSSSSSPLSHPMQRVRQVPPTAEQHMWQQSGMIVQQQQQQGQQQDQQQHSSQSRKSRSDHNRVCCQCESLIYPALGRRCVQCSHECCEWCPQF